MVHAYAGSRAGLKSVIAICELNAEATQAITQSRIIFDGHEAHETCEGPKFYKRNGYYYIFHPAGGVATGWQVVLRSKNIYGPYEWKTVLTQGETKINGPHQRGVGGHYYRRRLVFTFSRCRCTWSFASSSAYEMGG
mgnify:CR=1 FL=1